MSHLLFLQKSGRRPQPIASNWRRRRYESMPENGDKASPIRSCSQSSVQSLLTDTSEANRLDPKTSEKRYRDKMLRPLQFPPQGTQRAQQWFVEKDPDKNRFHECLTYDVPRRTRAFVLALHTGISN